MVIDGHTHIFPLEIRSGREKFVKSDKSFRLLYEDPRAPMAGADELIEDMNACGVDKAVICGFSWEDIGLCRLHNDYLLESARRHPDRLIPFAVTPPGVSGPVEAELQRVISGGMKGIGEAARYFGKDLSWIRPLAESAADCRLPLLIHTSEELGHYYPGKVLHGLKSLFEFIQAFPGLNIILAHWGGGLLFYELMPEVAGATQNVYYDTAASPYIYDSRIYEIAVKIIGEDRIIFGSDYPLLKPVRYIRDIESAGMEPSARRNILGGNFHKKLQAPVH